MPNLKRIQELEVHLRNLATRLVSCEPGEEFDKLRAAMDKTLEELDEARKARQQPFG